MYLTIRVNIKHIHILYMYNYNIGNYLKSLSAFILIRVCEGQLTLSLSKQMLVPYNNVERGAAHVLIK